jgi:hypothetical protein
MEAELVMQEQRNVSLADENVTLFEKKEMPCSNVTSS